MLTLQICENWNVPYMYVVLRVSDHVIVNTLQLMSLL